MKDMFTIGEGSISTVRFLQDAQSRNKLTLPLLLHSTSPKIDIFFIFLLWSKAKQNYDNSKIFFRFFFF